MKKILPFILCVVILVGCGNTGTIESGDATKDSLIKEAEGRGAGNVYEFRDLQTNKRLGDLILNDDDSVEITIDNTDITYVGYVESLGYDQNYHLSAAKPHTNWTNIAEGKDDDVYCIDSDIFICDYDTHGTAEYFAGLFNNLEAGANPAKPYHAKQGVIPIGNGYGKPAADKPVGQFARFITITNDDGTTCKMAQTYKNDGFVWSGELKADGVTYAKKDAIFYTEGRHISGSFENELSFMVKADNKELDAEITLTCTDVDNGVYKVKSYEGKSPAEVRKFLNEKSTKKQSDGVDITDDEGNVWHYNAPEN